MKGRLEFAAADAGPYIPCGDLRPQKGQDVKITAIKKINPRTGQTEVTAYKVEVAAAALVLNAAHLGALQHYFRVFYPSDNKEVKLGLRPYSMSHSGQLQRNVYTLDTINISFYIPVASYGTYATPTTPA